MEELQQRPTVLKFIETVCKEQGLHNHVITNVKTNQKGEGYLGEIFMVSVKDTKTGKLFQVVIKAAFVDEKVRELAPISASFQNEIYFYTCVLPKYQKLGREKGLLNILEFVPKCLKACVKEQEEMLALEDLKKVGFEIFDKTLILDEEHVKLIFKTYGIFHGYSYAWKDQKPEEYKTVTKKFINVYEEFVNNKMFSDHMLTISKLVESTFIPGEDDEIIKKYEKYAGTNIIDIFADLSRAEDKYSGLLHGDCWSNNMLFKYENTFEGRKLVDMRLIDWQLVKIGSPVCDLSYCLYSGCSKKVFDNLNEYLQIYHNSFSKTVRELGSDPDKLYPFSVLKEHWKKYSKFGMIMSFAILRMKLTNKDDVVDLTDCNSEEDLSEIFARTKFDEENYSKRIRGLLWHMSEINAL